MKLLVSLLMVFFITSPASAFSVSLVGLYNYFVPGSNSDLVSYSNSTITSTSATPSGSGGGGRFDIRTVRPKVWHRVGSAVCSLFF